MKKHLAFVTVVWVLELCLGSITQADSELYFRHDGGVAANDAEPLPEQLGSEAPLVWRRELPSGQSTPSVFGNLIFVTTYQGKELATVALDRDTGVVRWKQVAPTTRIEPYHQVGGPAAATPACDGKRVYVFFGSYGMLCYDLDGNPVWSKPMEPVQDEFGSPSSPILVDGKVILNEDHDLGSFLLAVDQETGERVWKTDRPGFTRSYSTPVVWEVGGRKQIVVAGALQLAAYDVDDGEKLWWVNGLARIVIPMPTEGPGMLYVASWSPGGDTDARIAMEPWSLAAKQWDKNSDSKITRAELPDGSPALIRFFRIDLNQDGGLDEVEWNKHAQIFDLAENSILAIRPGGKGDVTRTHVAWKYRRGVPYVPSPLVYRGVVYVVKNGGIVTSLDPASGKVLKQRRIPGRGNYYASPVAGDGKVYLVSEQGVITVLKAKPDWEVLSSHDFRERTLATPVIADGKIYLRTEEGLYCFRAQ